MDYNNLGISYFHQNRPKEAEFYFNKAIELNPQSAVAYNGLGILYCQQNTLTEAETYFNKAIELDPQNYKAYFNLGNLYKQQKKVKKAEYNYNKAIELNPQYDAAYNNLGNLYKQHKKVKEAEYNYNKAIEFNPQSDKSYFNLGLLYKQQNKLTKAETCFNKAIESNPQFGKAYFNLGLLYKQQNKLTKAETCFNKAIELNHQSDKAYFNLGLLYKQQKKVNEAKTYINQAIKINDNPIYNKVLSELNETLSNHILALNNMLDNLGKYEIEIISFRNLLSEIDSSQYKKLFENTRRYNSEVSKIVEKIEINNLNNLKNLYRSLIYLMLTVSNFKYELLVQQTDEINIFYQYTSINTLKSMLNIKTCCESTDVNIRLYNTDYMNDPDEGEFFINQLKKKGCHELLDEKYSVSHAFISSLTSSKDDIPMWSMYGNDSKGVSIGFSNLPVTSSIEDNSLDDSSDIQESSNNFPTNNNSEKEKTSPAYPYIEEKAKLYKVFYIDSEKDLELQKFEKIIKSISDELNKDKNVKDILYDSISKFISVELDRIKFLIKSDKYSYENEYRILQMVKDLSLDKSQIKYDSNNPKLYLEVKDINIEEVIFGVDSDNCILWRPILEMKIPNIDIRKINKSSVPLRYK